MKWKRRLGIIAMVTLAQIGIIYVYHVIQTTSLAWPSLPQNVRTKGELFETGSTPSSTEAKPQNPTPAETNPDGKVEATPPPQVQSAAGSFEPASIPDSGLKELVAQQVQEQHKATAEELQKLRSAESKPSLPEPPASAPPAVPAAPPAPPAPQPPSAPEPPATAANPRPPEPAPNPLLQDKGAPAAPPSPADPLPTPTNVPSDPAPISSVPPPNPAPAAEPESVVPAAMKINPRPAPAPGAPSPANPTLAQDPLPKPTPPLPQDPLPKTPVPLPQDPLPKSSSVKGVTSPWTIQVKVVDGRTVLTAYTTKDAQFRLACDKLELHAPHGDMKAVGAVTITSGGLDGSCESLTINLDQDLMLLEGKAQMKCLRDKRELEMKADRFSLRLSETTRGDGTSSKNGSGDSQSSAGKKQFKVFNLSVYQCRSGDSAAAISRRLYGTEKYAQALLQFNRDYQDRSHLTIAPGVTLYYPQKELLEYSYPDAVTRSQGLPQTSESY